MGVTLQLGSILPTCAPKKKEKKGLLLVIKTEYKISAKLTVKPSDCQKD